MYVFRVLAYRYVSMLFNQMPTNWHLFVPCLMMNSEVRWREVLVAKIGRRTHWHCHGGTEPRAIARSLEGENQLQTATQVKATRLPDEAVENLSFECGEWFRLAKFHVDSCISQHHGHCWYTMFFVDLYKPATDCWDSESSSFNSKNDPRCLPLISWSSVAIFLKVAMFFSVLWMAGLWHVLLSHRRWGAADRASLAAAGTRTLQKAHRGVARKNMPAVWGFKGFSSNMVILGQRTSIGSRVVWNWS